jgi:hypothetical protein
MNSFVELNEHLVDVQRDPFCAIVLGELVADAVALARAGVWASAICIELQPQISSAAAVASLHPSQLELFEEWVCDIVGDLTLE